MTRRKACFLGVLLAAGLPPLIAFAAAGQAPPAGAPEVRDDQVPILGVYLHQSKSIKAPWPVKRVSVTDPKIADVQVLTPNQVLVQGKGLGSTDLVLWSEKEDVWRVRVDVDVDLVRLKNEMTGLFPGSSLEFAQSEGVVLVKGLLARAEQAAQLRKFLDASALKYVDMTAVAGLHQVLIKVRVAEASRTALRLIGMNAFHTGHDFFGVSAVGSATGGAINPIHIGPAAGTLAARDLPFTFNADVLVSPSVTLFAGFPTADVQLFMQALAENQYLKILAEPTLVALSGEEASFLAGGEFPIPVVQTTTAGGTAITVEYREYGVRLAFRPQVLGDSTIRLFVAPEVSELTGVTQFAGFTVPGVITRRAETTLEMKSGQTFAMAGLISQTTDAITSRVPLLSDLPVLGPLFRSVRYRKGESELVVLVTASLVEPLSLERMPPGPGLLHVPPNEWEFYVEGRIEGKGPAKISSADAAWLKQQGLDRLVGPGAWVTYDQPAAQSQAILAVPEEEACEAEAPQTAPEPQAGP